MGWPQNAYVGQKVVCVNNADTMMRKWHSKHTKPVLGGVYTIAGFGESVYKGYVVIYLAEITNIIVTRGIRYYDCGYNIMRFRPVQERSTETGMEILRKLQDPTNHRQLEDA